MKQREKIQWKCIWETNILIFWGRISIGIRSRSMWNWNKIHRMTQRPTDLSCLYIPLFPWKNIPNKKEWIWFELTLFSSSLAILPLTKVKLKFIQYFVKVNVQFPFVVSRLHVEKWIYVRSYSMKDQVGPQTRPPENQQCRWCHWEAISDLTFIRWFRLFS